MKGEKAWQAALGQLQLEMPKAAFDTWVANTEFISYEDGFFIIGAPNAYARDWLENRLVSTATRLLTGLMGRSVEVNFVVWQQPAVNSEYREVYEEEESLEPSTRIAHLTHATTSKIL
jgi:chromosomal replication initiator protein